MRVLFTLLPGVGSLHPLLPLARAARAAGHEVAFCSSRSFRPAVAVHGFRYFAAGLDWTVSDPDYIGLLCAAAGEVNMPAVSGLARLAWVTDHLFIGAAATRLLPDLITVAGEFRADVIVRENLEYAGCVAAEALGLPHACVAAGSEAALDQRARLAPALSKLRAQAGLAPDADMPYRHLHLCASTPAFDGPHAEHPDTARFVRHRDTVDPTTPLPRWAVDRGDLPLVLVSLGTVFHRTLGVYETILEALGDTPAVVGIALGPGRDPTLLGPLPRRVHVQEWLPIPHLLDHAAAFVTHGGFNSVKEAMSRGVPMVVIPLASDQYYSAERCAALGLARVVPPDDRTPERVRHELHALLHDPGAAARAETMAADIAALPPLETAIAALEALVRSPRVAPGDAVCSDPRTPHRKCVIQGSEGAVGDRDRTRSRREPMPAWQ
jgi:UDP:flavonoid glycosyltransferase YjiC (YdhE family)